MLVPDNTQNCTGIENAEEKSDNIENAMPSAEDHNSLPDSELGAPAKKLSAKQFGPFIERLQRIFQASAPQPDIISVSTERVTMEISGISASLELSESKCINVDTKLVRLGQDALSGQTPKLNKDQWEALIMLHGGLLEEYHDWFLATQYPTATDAIRSLASCDAMAARLHKHGIHAFLEVFKDFQTATTTINKFFNISPIACFGSC
jgi:hypothetical protein